VRYILYPGLCLYVADRVGYDLYRIQGLFDCYLVRHGLFTKNLKRLLTNRNQDLLGNVILGIIIPFIKSLKNKDGVHEPKGVG